MLKTCCKKIRPNFYPRMDWKLSRGFAEDRKATSDVKDITEKASSNQPNRRNWEEWDDFFSPRAWNAPVSRIFDQLNRNFFRDDDLWRSPFMKGVSNEVTNWKPRTDVHETKDAFSITAELPGVSKENVKVEVDEDRNTLTLRGEKKSEVKHDEGDVHTSERVYGSFVRSWSLPDNVDAKSVKASFKDGVLKLEIPKVEKSKEKRTIDIQ